MKNFRCSGFSVMASALLFFLVLGLSGCATFSPEAVERGAFFFPHYDYSDSSIPIEEHAVLLNLAQSPICISLIDGKKARNSMGMVHAPATSLFYNNFTVLPAGEHSIGIYLYDGDLNGGREYTRRLTVNLLAGHYYFLDGSRISLITNRGIFDDISITDIAEYPPDGVASVYGMTALSGGKVPFKAIKAGIEAKLKK